MSAETALCSIQLPTGWKWQYLEDMCERVSVGHVGETSSFFCGAEGVPFLRSQNVRPGYLDLNDVRFITEEFHVKTKKSQLKRGDILIVRVGHNRGDCAVVPAGIDDLNCANMVFARPRSLNYADFFGYFFNSPFGRASLLAVSSGSAQAVLNTKAVAKVLVPVPPENTALVIGRVLRSFDDKIQLNRQINQTLEQMAQAIFKSWFVDFEPVKAKIAALDAGGSEEDALLAAMQAISGKDADQLARMQAEQPEQYAELRATAELFPSAMQDSELGEIPEGWECLALDAIAKYQNGLALQKFRPDNEDDFLPVVKIAQLKKGFADGVEKASTNIKPECIIDNGDVVFSWSGSLMVDIWCGGKAALNQHLFKVTSKRYPKWLYYCFTKHHLDEFQRIAAAKAVTMGHIKREHLKSALCAIPDEKLIQSGSKIIGQVLEKQIERRLESNTLSKIRDTLLPKLLSGEITVPEAEAQLAKTGEVQA